MSIINKIKYLILAYRIGYKAKLLKSLFPIFKHLFLKILYNQPPIGAELGITYRCNANCHHCSIYNYKKNINEELTTEQIKYIIDQVALIGCIKISLFGGEPLLRTDIDQIVAYAYGKHKLSVSIDTNAILLTEEKIQCLKKSGISNINISIDYPNAEGHDKFRGVKGCFDHAISGIDMLKRAGIPCIVQVFATHENIANGNLIKVINLAKQHQAVAVKITFPMLSGKLLEKSEISLSQNDKNEVRNLLQPGFSFIECLADPLRISCIGLDKKLIFISPYGDIQLCPVVPLSFGNILNTNLRNIRKKMVQHKMFTNNKKQTCDINDFLREYYNDPDVKPLFKNENN
ncbi:MAG: radical SAM protein [uncultured bacterium]|nr:MAG: radical SAM protein [uncultured bacterium]